MIDISLLVYTLLVAVLMGGSAVWHTSISTVQPVAGASFRQITFASSQLQHLYTHFNLSRLKPVAQYEIENIPSSKILLYDLGKEKGLPEIKVVIEHEEHISHIGFDIFGYEELKSIEPAGAFIERYFLYLFGENKNLYSNHLEADQVNVEVNHIRFDTIGSPDLSGVLLILANKSDFALHSSNYLYNFSCSDQEGNNLRILFPSRLDLISGKDKKELDEELARQLEVLPSPVSNTTSYFVGNNPQIIPYRDGLFYAEGKTLQAGLTSKQYYRLLDQHYMRLYDSNYPVESLQNLLTVPFAEVNVQLILDHRAYEQHEETPEVSLASLLHFMLVDHEVYVGFEELESGGIKSTQVFKNKIYDTSHMLIIEWPSTIPDVARINSVEAVFYSFIRNDNVKELVGEYIEKSGNQKIPVEVKQE